MKVPVVPAILLAATFALCLILNSLSSAQDAPKAHVRFFNDSARAVNSQNAMDALLDYSGSVNLRA